MWMTIVLFVVLSLVLLVYCHFRFKKRNPLYKAFYNIQTPPYIPLIGNTYLFLGRNVLTAAQTIISRYGKRCVVYLPHRTFCTCDPEEIKIILNEALEKSKEYNPMKIAFEHSLLLCKVPIWKKNRKSISKGFNQNLLDSMVPIFYEKSNDLLGILRKNDYNGITEILERLTLVTFLETMGGIKSSILTEANNVLVPAITEGQGIMFKRIGNILKMNDYIFDLLPDGKRIKQLAELGHNFIEPIIEQRRKRILKEEEVVFNIKDVDLLELLINYAKKENYTDEYITKELIFIGGAATDTTAYTLTYILCLLAMHKEVQKKVYHEVMAVVGIGEININHLLELKYTDMAINEAMRILPVVPMIGRQTTCDLDIGSCIVPKDTGIIIHILNMHRDPNIYPDPLVYNPDRFLPENVIQRHSYSFLPYSGGPRNCLGFKYAQLSMKVNVANIVRNFEITTPYKSILDLEFESNAVMSTKHPVKLHFSPRNSES